MGNNNSVASTPPSPYDGDTSPSRAPRRGGNRFEQRGPCTRRRRANGRKRTERAGEIDAADVGRTRAPARGGAPGRRATACRGAACQGQADGPRAHRRAARSGVVRGIRHVRRASLDRLRHGDPEDPGRRRGDRPWHDQRPAGLCLQPGFHRVRRRAVGHACRQDLQGHGQRHEGRCAGAGAE